MVPSDLLRRLRNDLPMSVTISALGREGPPSKMRDGRFVFLCPSCGDMLVAVNPRNNLAHCFGCGKNLNNIDLSLDYNFADTIALLKSWLRLTRLNDQRTRQQARSRHIQSAPLVQCCLALERSRNPNPNGNNDCAISAQTI